MVSWLATDHLGSTAVTANESGARITELRYKPWGESRYSFGVTPTARLSSPKSQRRFTGQVVDSVAGGLYFYNARYYHPALGRFLQPDTMKVDGFIKTGEWPPWHLNSGHFAV